MIRTFILTAAALGLLAAADTPAPAAPKPYPIDTCLVMGDKVGADAVAVVVEGQEFKVCCKGCIKKIQKDPKGYLAKLEAAVKEQEAKKAAAPAK